MKISLTVLGGSYDGHTRSVQEFPLVLGRGSACDWVLDDRWASRKHCTLHLRDGRVFVEDAGSTHGTFVNGVPIEHETPLEEGDRLTIGLTTVRFSAAAPARRLFRRSISDSLMAI